MMFESPREVSDVMLAFPASVVGEYLPEWNDIPEGFRKSWNSSSGACGLASDIFDARFGGGEKIGFVPMDGIDPGAAWRHIVACLGSFEPKHEHKIAGVGYLISLWIKAFIVDDVVYWQNRNAKEGPKDEEDSA